MSRQFSLIFLIICLAIQSCSDTNEIRYSTTSDAPIDEDELRERLADCTKRAARSCMTDLTLRYIGLSDKPDLFQIRLLSALANSVADQGYEANSKLLFSEATESLSKFRGSGDSSALSKTAHDIWRRQRMLGYLDEAQAAAEILADLLRELANSNAYTASASLLNLYELSIEREWTPEAQLWADALVTLAPQLAEGKGRSGQASSLLAQIATKFHENGAETEAIELAKLIVSGKAAYASIAYNQLGDLKAKLPRPIPSDNQQDLLVLQRTLANGDNRRLRNSLAQYIDYRIRSSEAVALDLSNYPPITLSECVAKPNFQCLYREYIILLEDVARPLPEVAGETRLARLAQKVGQSDLAAHHLESATDQLLDPANEIPIGNALNFGMPIAYQYQELFGEDAARSFLRRLTAIVPEDLVDEKFNFTIIELSKIAARQRYLNDIEGVLNSLNKISSLLAINYGQHRNGDRMGQDFFIISGQIALADYYYDIGGASRFDQAIREAVRMMRAEGDDFARRYFPLIAQFLATRDRKQLAIELVDYAVSLTPVSEDAINNLSDGWQRGDLRWPWLAALRLRLSTDNHADLKPIGAIDQDLVPPQGTVAPFSVQALPLFASPIIKI